MSLINSLLCRYTDRPVLAETVMTIGIYRLVFKGTSQCYIGQSIQIEQRFKAHINSFKNKTCNPKLLNAYAYFGLPQLDILCECSEKELDCVEAEAIEIFDSVDNGFNIYRDANQTPKYYGENSPRCKFSNYQLITVAKLLANPNNKAKDIAEQLNVTLDVVQSIASLKCHGWIKEEIPEIYKTLVELKGTRKNPKAATYNISVISPTGIVYTNITNLKTFCELHQLDRANFRKLLKGKQKVCSGWKVINQWQ